MIFCHLHIKSDRLFRKTDLKTDFSEKSKVAFPKTEVLEKPQSIDSFL